jgi:hypothetical protein
MLDRQEEYMLAKRWREDGDHDVLGVLNGRERRIFVAGAWPKTSRSRS